MSNLIASIVVMLLFVVVMIQAFQNNFIHIQRLPLSIKRSVSVSHSFSPSRLVKSTWSIRSVSSSTALLAVKLIQPQELEKILKDDKIRLNYQLVDVRELDELAVTYFKEQSLILNLPLSTSMIWTKQVQNGELLEATKPTIVICKAGIRSMNAAMFLDKLGFQEVYSLDGGIKKYADQVDDRINI